MTDPSRRTLTAAMVAAAAGLAGQRARAIQSTPDSILILDTISKLVAEPVGTQRIVALVLGYSAVNDGGGGFFYWDTSATQAADGGTVFQSSHSTNGRWLRLSL